MKRTLGPIFGLAMLVAGAGAPLAQGIPGGATSLNETHGDWTVSCTAPAGIARCTIMQLQVQGESRQRVLAIELATDGSGASGTLVLPFGLRLDDGITLGLDEMEPFQSLRFSTCLPAGCVVAVTFGSDLVSALGRSSLLSVKATANDSGDEVAFSVSLRGIPSALARLAQVTGP